jgi:alkylation response protein AidB-like acyl-CoA dehydrogenase
MEFAATEEQNALRERVLRFARESLGERAAQSDQEESLDTAGWKRCAGFGVLGWPVPREYGGSGLDPLTTALAYEEFGYACRDNGLVFAVDNHVWACAVYVLHHGTEEQKRRLLPGLCDGSTIGAHALTERDCGSDVLSVTTAARPEGDGWRLSGFKSFISNAPCADVFVVLARTGDASAAPQSALSAFLVPRDLPGLRVRPMAKAGLRGCPMGEIEFADCPLPAEALLGRSGAGYQIFTSTIEWERGLMFASKVGLLRRLLETSVEYARSRRQFGRPIGAYQAVAHPLADLKVRLELARLLLYKVAWLKREGRMALLETSMLKLFVSESLVSAGLRAMQLHGARGYVTEFGVERELRDVLGTTIFGGTSEVQRNIVASLLGLPSLT